MVFGGLILMLAVIAGLLWLFYHFSQQQRCIRSTVAEGKLNAEQATKWCDRNARWG